MVFLIVWNIEFSYVIFLETVQSKSITTIISKVNKFYFIEQIIIWIYKKKLSNLQLIVDLSSYVISY